MKCKKENHHALIVGSSKATGFIAGADIETFKTVQDNNEGIALIKQGQSVFNRLAALPCPTVAMIDGICLGGGLELALACSYRVAEQTPKTRLGLPEVKLGIQPGWGGTLRLPRLINPLHALDMMLSGRLVKSKLAYRWGLVDAIVPARQLKQAASQYALADKITKKIIGFLFKLLAMSFVGWMVDPKKITRKR